MTRKFEPAFPVEWTPGSSSEVAFGMSLRDYFAAAAAQGFLAMSSAVSLPVPKPHEIADFAYKVADAMLEARAK